MLLRDGPAGVEVFVLRRRAALAFAGGMHVFPGGGVDPRDAAACAWVGPAAAELAPSLSATLQQAHALVVAAVRETFEECGVLLAGRGPEDVVDAGGAAWESEREALARGDVGLADLLERHTLALRADLLRPWAHWLTPLAEPRRFDTRFFVAALPGAQRAREVLGEADRAGWVSAGAALSLADAGEVAIMPPTRVCLEELAAAGTVAAVLATPRCPARVMPWLAVDEQGRPVVEVDIDGAGGGQPGPDA
jgi:8-oxo-dGTP pyrophosphatase MutT (NUDIX family)